MLIALFLASCTRQSQSASIPIQASDFPVQVTNTPSPSYTITNNFTESPVSRSDNEDHRTVSLWLCVGVVLAIFGAILSFLETNKIEQIKKMIDSVPTQDVVQKAQDWKCLHRIAREILQAVKIAESKLNNLKTASQQEKQNLYREIEDLVKEALTLYNEFCEKFDEIQNLSEQLTNLLTQIQQRSWGSCDQLVYILVEYYKGELKRAQQISACEEAKEIIQKARRDLVHSLLQITREDNSMSRQALQIINSTVETVNVAGDNSRISSISNRETINAENLAAELSRLHEELTRRELTPDQEVDVYIVQKACEEAKNKNIEKARLYLLKVSSFVLDVAREIAADIVIKFLRGSQ